MESKQSDWGSEEFSDNSMLKCRGDWDGSRDKEIQSSLNIVLESASSAEMKIAFNTSQRACLEGEQENKKERLTRDEVLLSLDIHSYEST